MNYRYLKNKVVKHYLDPRRMKQVKYGRLKPAEIVARTGTQGMHTEFW
jgi:hypothetical protein